MINYRYKSNISYNKQILKPYQINNPNMQQEQKRAKQKKHQKLQQKLKKQANTEDIGTYRVSYSYLDKKNNSGISTNNRLFFLIHKQRIGYINQLPKGQLLPFQVAQALPKLKASVELDNIQKVISEKQVLKISFNKSDKKQNWEFNCASQDLAKSWVKRITGSMQQRKYDKLNPPRDIVVEGRPKSIKPEDQSKKIQGQNEQKKNGGSRPISTQQNQPNNPNSVQNIPILSKQSNLSQQKLVQKQKMQQKYPQGQQNIQNYNQNGSQVPNFGYRSNQPQKTSILKPVSSLFVGGMSVNTEKDQTQLKNRMQSFQSVTSRIKQQYQRKKLQQKKLNQQIKNQTLNKGQQEYNNIFSSNIANNLLSFSTNTKYQIQKMQREWGYEFAKSQNEYEIIQKFKYYVQAVSTKIIDELGLEQKKRYYQPIQNINNNIIKYQINGVLFEIYLTQLKQITSHIYTQTQRGTILLNQAYKISSHQFKNYNYMLKLTQNKGKIRVPLSMITQYKGINVYAKVLIPSTQVYDKMQLLQKQLQILQQQSRINNSIFQDPQPDTGRIIALNSKIYQKLSRAQNNSTRKFDICYIQNLKYYLPHDFNNFNKSKPYQRLRYQLISDDECEDKILYGQDMCSISNRLKLPQHIRDGINQLTQISKLIIDRIQLLVQLLQGCDQYFTNSQQLSNIIHKNGINMRYLGLLMEKLKQNWLKQIIMSEICARCAKKYLFFDLQDCILNLSENNLQNVYKFQIKQVINFLNKMLGNSSQMQIFWKQLNRQSQQQYRVSINRQQININYLLQALQYHGCFKLTHIQYQPNAQNKIAQPVGDSKLKSTLSLNNNNNNNMLKANSKIGIAGTISNTSINLGLTNLGQSTYSPSRLHSSTPHNNNLNIQIFNSPTPFSTSNFGSFQHKSKVYNAQFTQLYTSIKSIISQQNIQSYEQLKLLLNLNRNQYIPSHFKLSQYHQNIIIFLINWISPTQSQHIYHQQQLQIQIGQLLPNKLLYIKKLAEIRWKLKQGLVQQTQPIKQWIINHINKWIGQYHPILTELYQIYANYFMMFKDQQKKAVNFCKSVIRNQQLLIGLHHHKMADCYYLLGTIYKNYSKKLQAINSYKKSKQIILKSHNQQSQAYGEVCLKMSQLFITINQTKQSIQQGIQAMNILQKCNNSQALIQSIQLICRCYQIQENWEEYLNLIQNNLIHKISDFIDDIQLLERIIKVCIFPSFMIIAQSNSSIGQKIVKIINQLPDTTRAPNMAYNFLRARIEEKVFPHKFLQALGDIEDILEEIENNGMLARWKGFQNLTNKSLLNKVGVNLENRGFNFIANLEALNIFIGSSYIQGILLEQ